MGRKRRDRRRREWSPRNRVGPTRIACSSSSGTCSDTVGGVGSDVTITIEATDGGFAIVFEVVEAHGWRITVSESDAGGLRFEISTADEDGSVVTATPVQDRQ
ncbi:sensor histidine kinase [Natrinema longum]|uniref:Sensor histidine kinase n=1 Tax=Natrinema longum TaxID=370324 RepID=A0A8A2UDL9_9EURY|nr:hypothetical protein [Natrinema longum]QSW86572.1 sensor histidine kinase [Natrinema longum]